MLRTAALFMITCTVVHAFHWSYKNQAQWPELCLNGKTQSPINLDASLAKEENFSHFVFNHYSVGYPATVKNNGHSITLKIGTPYPSISGGGLTFDEYILDHLHFHWQSEHTVNGYRYPLELHAVHYAKQFENLTVAKSHKGGLAVLGILYNYSPDDDLIFSQVSDVLKNVINAQETGVSHMEGVYVQSFLPRDTAGYFRYEGSLTTPDCDESVTWTVFTNVISISDKQIKPFLSVQLEEGTPMENYRKLQQLGNRNLYHKVSPITGSSNRNRLCMGLLYIFCLIFLYVNMNTSI